MFPFDAEEEIDLTLDILGAPLYIPEFLSSDAEDCITKFLERKPQLRLGYQKGCLPSPMHEPFFTDVEWGKIFNEELNPPFVPLLQSVGKTYLSSTTGDSRLNNHMILQVHKDGTDAPTLVDEANYFVGEKENRKQLFGNFFCERYPKQVPYLGQSQHKRQIRDQNKKYQRQIS